MLRALDMQLITQMTHTPQAPLAGVAVGAFLEVGGRHHLAFEQTLEWMEAVELDLAAWVWEEVVAFGQELQQGDFLDIYLGAEGPEVAEPPTHGATLKRAPIAASPTASLQMQAHRQHQKEGHIRLQDLVEQEEDKEDSKKEKNRPAPTTCFTDRYLCLPSQWPVFDTAFLFLRHNKFSY